jgi:hypothetical protein
MKMFQLLVLLNVFLIPLYEENSFKLENIHLKSIKIMMNVYIFLLIFIRYFIYSL